LWQHKELKQLTIVAGLPLPDGKTLRTLEDARRHILALPKSEHETTWQVAIEALLVAAEKRPVMQPAGENGSVHSRTT
jgi:hypothetical protein